MKNHQQIAVFFLLLLSALTCSTSGSVFTDFSLDGDCWSVHNHNFSVAINGTCRVPGDIYGDLMYNSVIGNPFYRYGDEKYRWIAYENWTYHRNFETPSGFEDGQTQQVVLVVEGMQVVTEIRIDGVVIGNTTDEFQRYVFDVSAVLLGSVKKEHEIVVAFTSSVAYATHRHEIYDRDPMPHAPAYLTGLPHRNFIRAEQSSFGWDWSPAFAPQGIYKPVFLRAYKRTKAHCCSGSIDHLTPHIFPLPFNQSVGRPLSDSDNSFWVQFYVYVSFVGVGNLPPSGSILLEAMVRAPTLNGLVNSSNLTVTRTTGTPNNDSLALVVDGYVHNVKLWWPSQYGNQTLHEVSVTLTMITSTGTRVEFDQHTIALGIRSIELITYGDPLSYRPPAAGKGENVTPDRGPSLGSEDAIGDRPVMFFRVNGIPIFAKGANLVPFDAFQSRVNKTFMEDILDSAVDANMNMIRVWGGGLFPLDSFYEMADRKGILLWQEMIFACSQYPIDSFFLSEVRSEIRHQLRRLGKYSSIAIWSGNNEDGIYDKGPGSPYEVLDYGTVLAELIREDTSRPIWPSFGTLHRVRSWRDTFWTSCRNDGPPSAVQGWGKEWRYTLLQLLLLPQHVAVSQNEFRIRIWIPISAVVSKL